MNSGQISGFSRVKLHLVNVTFLKGALGTYAEVKKNENIKTISVTQTP